MLLGRAPSDFAMPPQPLQKVAVSVPAGLPSTLLERRPDIAAAERAMAAANARVGAAKSAFFPRLDITGAFGYESSELGNLFQWSSRTFLLGPLVGAALSMPIFDGGRRQAAWTAPARSTRRGAVPADGAECVPRGRGQSGEPADSGGPDAGAGRRVASAARAAKLSHTQYREGRSTIWM